MVPAPTDEVGYEIDSDDRVAALDPSWGVAAREQGLDCLDRARVIGRPISEFIADVQTAEVFRLLFAAVRKSHRPFLAPFRCDTPTMRRFMTLSIAVKTGGDLRVVSRILHTETRPYVALIDHTVARTVDLVSICGWCKRVPLPNGTWIEIEEAMRTLGMMQQSRMPSLTHGVCPDCSNHLQRELDALSTG